MARTCLNRCLCALCHDLVPDYAHRLPIIYHHGHTPRWTADHISSTVGGEGRLVVLVVAGVGAREAPGRAEQRGGDQGVEQMLRAEGEADELLVAVVLDEQQAHHLGAVLRVQRPHPPAEACTASHPHPPAASRAPRPASGVAAPTLRRPELEAAVIRVTRHDERSVDKRRRRVQAWLHRRKDQRPKPTCMHACVDLQ